MTNPTQPQSDPPPEITHSMKLDPRQLEELRRQGKGLAIPARNLVSQQPGAKPGVILGAERRPWPAEKAEKELAVAEAFAQVFSARHPWLPKFEGLEPGGDPPPTSWVS